MMDKRAFFKTDEINRHKKWVVDSTNSDLAAMKLTKQNLEEGETINLSMNSSEALIINASGKTALSFNGYEDVAEKLDVLYLTNGDACVVKALQKTEVLICESNAERKYMSRFIKITDVTPMTTGEGCHLRKVWNMLPPDIEAERLILGICESEIPGGWTGWPPHEHGGKLEEIYYYYGISGLIPGVLQLSSADLRDEVRAYSVTNGDVFAISGGYHPIVAFPGVIMKNIWFMAAVTPEDRNFGVVQLDSAFGGAKE